MNCYERREDCDNNIDDDDDDDGDFHVDCADADCAGNLTCTISGYEICNNNIDDNGDGHIDCDDPYCRTSRFFALPREVCGNYMDDDGDGFTDFSDVDCQTFEACGLPAGELCNNAMATTAMGLLIVMTPPAHFSRHVTI